MGSRTGSGPSSGSLGKALGVLRCFVDRQERWGVREIAAALDLPGSTAHRYLKILAREGFLAFDGETQKYHVGMELYRISAVLSRRLRIREAAGRFMGEFAAATGKGCWLALYDKPAGEVVWVAAEPGLQALGMSAPIGRREALVEGSAGEAVLAFLPAGDLGQALAGDRLARPERESRLEAIRASGHVWAYSTAAAPGTVIAVPVFDAGEAPIAVLGATAGEGGSVPAELARHLRQAAARLSRALGSQLLGGAGAGSWQLAMGPIAEIVARRLPELGMTVSLGAGNTNLAALQAGRAAYCMAVAGSLDAAWQGRGAYRTPHDRLRGMFAMFPLYLHVLARRDVAASGLADLSGLRISASERGFTTAAVFERLYVLACGPEADLKGFRYLDYAEANRQFRDGRLDVVVSLAGVPNPAYAELARDPGLRLVGIEAAVAGSFLAAEPSYEPGVIAAGTYPGVETDIATVCVPAVMCTVADRPEDEVYRITRAIHESRDALVSAAPAFRHFTPGYVYKGWSSPIHPGAARYWAEIGVEAR